jgi:hypothetical protein
VTPRCALQVCGPRLAAARILGGAALATLIVLTLP